VDHEVPLQGVKGRAAERARDLIRHIYEMRDVVTVRWAVSPDHVHMPLPAPADLVPSKLVQSNKRRSSGGIGSNPRLSVAGHPHRLQAAFVQF